MNATTITTFANDGLSTVASKSATRMPGIDREMSTMRMSSASSQPPTKPAIKPMTEPNVPVIMMPSHDTDSEIRAPKISRLNASRPLRSVPSRWSRLPPAMPNGGLSRSVSVPSTGECGARTGAKVAHTAKTVTTASGASGGQSRLS
jgi:hypothetical protein